MVLGSAANNDPLFFLSIFAVGAVAIAHWGRISVVGESLARRRGAWPVVALIAVLLTTARWELLGLGMPAAVVDRFEWVSVLGALLVVFCAALWRPLRRGLESRPAQWLGRVSFSLYLVHEPVIIATRTLLAGLAPWVTIVVAIAIAFGIAALFTRFVELPLHRLARATGAAVTRRGAPAARI